MLNNRTWLIAVTLIAGLVTGVMADDSVEQQLKSLQAQLKAVQ